MIKEDKARIIQGLVLHKGHWVPIENKVKSEIERQKKIKSGYVKFHGEWITIEEKIKRITPTPEKKAVPQNITINKNDNRTVYNISHHHDHRVHQETINENKHIHMDERLKIDQDIPEQSLKKLTQKQKLRLLPGDDEPQRLPRPDHFD